MVMFGICMWLWGFVIKWILTAKRLRKESLPVQPIERDPQIDIEIEHCKRQLDLYYEMLWAAEDALSKARNEVELDDQLNKYGAVIPEKVQEKHSKEFQKCLNRVATLNNKIHNMERRLSKYGTV